MLFAAPASVRTSARRRAMAVLRLAIWQHTAGAMACPSQRMAGAPSLSSLCKLCQQFCKFRKVRIDPVSLSRSHFRPLLFHQRTWA
ncbi:unnamed protein product [Symbiodinium sp. CCMP2592]|nr:unnamed protein product [Symbiodinium sp. CCMP2592]